MAKFGELSWSRDDLEDIWRYKKRDLRSHREFRVPMPLSFLDLEKMDIIILTNTEYEFNGIADRVFQLPHDRVSRK